MDQTVTGIRDQGQGSGEREVEVHICVCVCMSHEKDMDTNIQYSTYPDMVEYSLLSLDSKLGHKSHVFIVLSCSFLISTDRGLPVSVAHSVS